MSFWRFLSGIVFGLLLVCMGVGTIWLTLNKYGEISLSAFTAGLFVSSIVILIGWVFIDFAKDTFENRD